MTFTIPQRDRLIWYAVDLDGTLAEDVWPNPGVGAPIEANVAKLRQVVDAGFKVIVHTARSWEAYETIEAWLNHHEIPWHRIVCGKLLAVKYVDDRGVSADMDSWLDADSCSHSVRESDENGSGVPQVTPDILAERVGTLIMAAVDAQAACDPGEYPELAASLRAVVDLIFAEVVNP